MKIVFAALVAVTIPFAVLAQVDDCKSGEGYVAAQAEIDRSLSEVKDSAAVSRIASKLAALGWSEDRQKDAINAVFSSAPTAGLQKERRAHLAALSDAVVSSSGPDPRVSKCQAARQVNSLAVRIVALDRQIYDHAARGIGITVDAGR